MWKENWRAPPPRSNNDESTRPNTVTCSSATGCGQMNQHLILVIASLLEGTAGLALIAIPASAVLLLLGTSRNTMESCSDALTIFVRWWSGARSSRPFIQRLNISETSTFPLLPVATLGKRQTYPAAESDGWTLDVLLQSGAFGSLHCALSDRT